MERVVVVGGGLAGHRAVDALRRAGYVGAVTLISDERHAPYDRPPLSKQVLAGLTEPVALEYAAFADVDVQLGVAAVGLEVDRRVVTTTRGELAYDGLLIATGRRARQLAVPDLEGFHTLRTLDDAARLRAAITTTTPVAVVGAGFVGCEVAATLRGLGVAEVALIDVSATPMPVLGPEIGGRAAELHRARGVDLHLGVGVAEFEGEGRVERVVLKDGTAVRGSEVLIAVGSVPSTEWLVGSGLDLTGDGAVRVDDRCFALGADSITVAGDVAAFPHPASGEHVCIEHWAIARDMGSLAAQNLVKPVEDRRPFTPVPSFWSDQYDVKIKSAGFLGLADRVEVLEEDPDSNALVAEAFQGDELVGAVAFNRNKAIIGYQRQLGAAHSRSSTRT